MGLERQLRAEKNTADTAGKFHRMHLWMDHGLEFELQRGHVLFEKQQENDRYKTELAKKHGYKIARIPYWLNDDQVEKEIDNILAGNPSYPDVPDLKQAETKPLPK